VGAAFGRYLRAICLSVAAAAITALAVFVFSYLLFPVAGIEVTGARMLPESQVWEAVSEHASLLTLNPETLEHRVESNPWVEAAEVTKNWRSGIVLVQVEERRAVLNGVRDGRRVILAADGAELPGLGGADLDRVEVDEDQVEDILEAGRTLRRNGMALESVDAVGAGGVEATVEGRRVLFADGLEDGQAHALPGVMEKHPEAPHFDLRSPGRVVVGAAPAGGSSG
jgi:cell division protein FtsQ